MPKTLPTEIHTFIVADNLREEANSKKVTIIGAMATGGILLKDRPPFPVNLPLAFFIAFKNGEGEFDAKFRLFDPSGKQMGADFPLGRVKKEPSQAMQLLINFGNLPITSEGEFKIQIALDNQSYDESFSVNYAPDASPKA